MTQPTPDEELLNRVKIDEGPITFYGGAPHRPKG